MISERVSSPRAALRDCSGTLRHVGHVDHQRLQQHLESEDQRHGGEHPFRSGSGSPPRRCGSRRPTRRSERRGSWARRSEEKGDRREIGDEVPPGHRAAGSSETAAREGQCVQRRSSGSPLPRMGRDVDVPHHRPVRYRLASMSVSKKNSRRSRAAQPSRAAAVDGGEAVGRIEHVPVPGGDLGQEREPALPHQAHVRHLARASQGRGSGCPSCSRRSPPQDGRDQPLHVARVHLSVGVDLDRDSQPRSSACR